MQKFALVLAALLALAAGRWWVGNKAAMHAQSEPPLIAPTPSESSSQAPSAVSNSASPAGGESSPAVTQASKVSVKPGETLIEICVTRFGRCSPDLLQEIHRLNPQMNNLDHIEPGQMIQLPLAVANLGQPEPSISGSNHE
jgi:hypothetical protein